MAGLEDQVASAKSVLYGTTISPLRRERRAPEQPARIEPARNPEAMKEEEIREELEGLDLLGNSPVIVHRRQALEKCLLVK